MLLSYFHQSINSLSAASWW